jgi:hypothetical protein
LEVNPDMPSPPAPSPAHIETVADLVTTLGQLTDRQRRGFGYWADPKALFAGLPRRRGSSRAFRAAAGAFARLRDDTLTREERFRLRRDRTEEACWFEGSVVAGRLADAIEQKDQAALRQLAPAIDWLREAARTGADQIAIEIPRYEPGPEEQPARALSSMSDFERRFHGPLWGYKGAALFGAVCMIPFISRPSLATPLASFGPPLVAFAVGFVWLLGIMALIHWLGLKSDWDLQRKRRVLIGAFLAVPVAGLVIARILGG